MSVTKEQLNDVLRIVRGMAWKRGRGWGMEDELFSVGETAIAQKIHQYDPDKIPFGPWATLTARRAMQDFLRSQDPQGRRGRERVKSGQESGLFKSKNGRRCFFERVRLVSDECLRFRGSCDRRNEGPDLHLLVKELTPKRRDAVIGKFFDEKTLDQIGSELGLTEGRISQLVQEGLRDLRDIYERAS